MTADLPVALASARLILYAFHLRNSLDQSTQTVTATAPALWDSVVALGEKLECDDLRQLRNSLKCYQQDAHQQWHYNPAQEGNVDEDFARLLRQDGSLEFTLGQTLTGEFDAFRIHDTYIADLTWFTDQTIEVADLSQLNPHELMFPGPLTASLGQTLVLFAKPTEECSDYQALAQACVTALLPPATQLPKQIAEGQLFGGPLFEFELEIGHLLVWFNVHEQTQSLVQNHSVDFLNLLGSRHKLRYVRQLARQSYRAARELYSQLEVKVKVFEELIRAEGRLERLDHLVIHATHLAMQYAHHLRNIQDHHNTIEVNTLNYETVLQQMQAQNIAGDNLGLFEQFLAQSRLWQKQLQVDLTYLSNTGSLFDRTINSARSMTEIDTLKQLQQTEEKASKRQHDLEILVATVASLLEGAVVSAKVNHDLPARLFSSLPLHLPESANFFQTLGYHLGGIMVHLGVGVIVAVVLVSLIKLWLKRKHR